MKCHKIQNQNLSKTSDSKVLLSQGKEQEKKNVTSFFPQLKQPLWQLTTINRNNQIPWNKAKKVNKLRRAMETNGFILKHVYRESNRVNKLACLGHECCSSQYFVDFNSVHRVIERLKAWWIWTNVDCQTQDKSTRRVSNWF